MKQNFNVGRRSKTKIKSKTVLAFKDTVATFKEDIKTLKKHIYNRREVVVYSENILVLIWSGKFRPK